MGMAWVAEPQQAGRWADEGAEGNDASADTRPAAVLSYRNHFEAYPRQLVRYPIITTARRIDKHILIERPQLHMWPRLGRVYPGLHSLVLEE